MLASNHPYRVVFVVAHPDDESLWCGGLVHAFCGTEIFSVSVICLSGNDLSSPRVSEFNNAMRIAGCQSYTVVGGPLQKATDRLQDISTLLASALAELSMTLQDVDLLITHSPTGEEHAHPHHVQLSMELFRLAKRNSVSFANFACLANTRLIHKPILNCLRRQGSLLLLQKSRCRFKLAGWLDVLGGWRGWHYPRTYYQFSVDRDVKNSMLSCYQSVNLEEHRSGYAMFSCYVESIYLFDRHGEMVVDTLIDGMEIPGCQDIFPSLRKRAMRFLLRVLQ